MDTNTATTTKPNDQRPLIIKISLLVFLLLTLFLSLVAVLGRLIINVRQQERSAELITREDLQTVNPQSNFIDSGQEKFVYQSPVYNFEVTLDTKSYQLIETQSGILLYHKDVKVNRSIKISVETISVSQYELANIAKSEKDYILKYLEKSQIVEEKTIQLAQNVEAIRISYTRQSFTKQPYYQILVLAIKGSALYRIEYSEATSQKLSGDELTNILSSLNWIDSSSLSANTTYVSSLWGYLLNYDNRLFKLSSFGVSSIELSTRQTSSQQDAVNLSISAIEISRRDLVDNEQSYVSDYVIERKNNLKNSDFYPQLTFDEDQNVIIDGKSVKVISYSTDLSQSFSKMAYYREYFLINYNALIHLKLNFADKNGKNLAAITKTVEGLDWQEPSNGFVKGITSSSLEEEKAVLIAKPSVVRIYVKSCGSLDFPDIKELKNTSNKQYTICTANSGSGFYVNYQGYLATNGHVVSISNYDLVYYAITTLYSRDLVINVLKDYYLPKLPELKNFSDQKLYEYLKDNPNLTTEIASGIADLIVKAGVDLKLNKEIYVQRGNAIFSLNGVELTNKDAHYPAQIVDINYTPTEDKIGISDVALLKVNGLEDLPVLSLGDSDQINQGATLLVLGFPSIVTDSNFLADSAKGEETITKGIISAKKIAIGGDTLIQTDASVQKGNSGGPGITLDGKALGMATFIVKDSGSADYNFLIDIEETNKLMLKNKIDNELGSSEKNWRKGIEQLFSGYFSDAINSFSQAKTSNPDLVEADLLIELAKQKRLQGLEISSIDVQGNQDVFALLNSLTTSEKVLFLLVIILLGLVFILLTTTIIIFLKLRKISHKLSPAPPTSQNNLLISDFIPAN